MNKKLAIMVGDNFEEIEMVATVDVLRRAKIDVDIVSVYNDEVMKGSHGIQIKSDKLWKDYSPNDYDGIIIPGGPGVDHGQRQLIDQDKLIKAAKDNYDDKKLVAALCAAPQVLGKAEILNDKEITHFPGSDKYLENSKSDLSKPSIIDGNVITGASAGSAIQFALNIVEYYEGKEEKEKLAKILVMNYR